MSLSRPITALICLLIAGITWLAVLSGHRTEIALAAASMVSVLCAAILLLRRPSAVQTPEKPCTSRKKDESAEFRRGLFQLCAALKLGIRYCEDHLHSEPDRLLAELERMQENIGSFINGVARPVRFYQRVHWPWRMVSRGRPQR